MLCCVVEMDSVAAQGTTAAAQDYVGSAYGTEHQRSGYGHGHGGHSGYGGHSGHSGYGGHSAHGGHSSGYGHSGHSGGYGKKDECCPLVVDLLCLAAILGAIAGASLLLNQVIMLEIMTGKRRRKKRSNVAYVGDSSIAYAIHSGERACRY